MLARLANHDPAANEELQGKDDLRGLSGHQATARQPGRGLHGGGKLVLHGPDPDGELVILDEDGCLRRDATTRLETRPVLD